MLELGEKVRRMRQKRGLTLSQLALLTKVSSVTVHNIEKGIYEPKISTLLDLCHALETPLSNFISPGPKSLFFVQRHDTEFDSKRKKSVALSGLGRIERLELCEGCERNFPKDPGQIIAVHLVFGRFKATAGERVLEAVQGDNIYIDLMEDVTIKAKENTLAVIVYFPGGSK
ncbi:helix-turn-helix domain-containing protein [bacterium]|nr:helix-turn-helix domain-containing protein [bacterium]